MEDEFSLENRFNIYVMEDVIEKYKKGEAKIDYEAKKVYFNCEDIDIYDKEIEYLKEVLNNNN